MIAQWKTGVPPENGRYLCCVLQANGSINVCIKSYRGNGGPWAWRGKEQDGVFAWDYLPKPKATSEKIEEEKAKLQKKINEEMKKIKKLQENLERLSIGE